MQNLQLTELREQYQHRMDYTKCSETLQVEDLPEEIIEIYNDTLDLNTTNSTDDEDVYEYNIFLDGDVEQDSVVESGNTHHCDQQSCQVEVHDANVNERPGFFGSITKLLQPLFTLDL